MKGIILAAGSGSRLYPITKGTSKQLLPVYDKPMIFYPLSVLMLAGIKDILIITSPKDKRKFKNILGNGEDLGIKVSYEVQKKPVGLAHAFIVGEEFVGDEDVTLILGDNIFWGQGLTPLIKKSISENKGATVFAYNVPNPSEFGIVEIDENNRAISIEEKPVNPKTSLAVTGLYVYDNSVIEIAKKLKPSKRGELEITDVNNKYLEKGKLKVEVLGRGFAWLDTGTHESLLEASTFVQTIEKRQNFKIACIEEISFRNGWLTKDQLINRANEFSKSSYGMYLHDLVKLIK